MQLVTLRIRHGTVACYKEEVDVTYLHEKKTGALSFLSRQKIVELHEIDSGKRTEERL